MLIDDDGVKPEAVRQHQLLEVALIEFISFLGVVVFIWKTHPGRFELLVIFRQRDVWHKVHHIESESSAHCFLLLRNA